MNNNWRDMQATACAAVANILTLPENDEVMVVGTVYKDMKLKPSILDEYVKVRVLQSAKDSLSHFAKTMTW